MKSKAKMTVSVSCAGLTVFDLPTALEVCDIVVVEEEDGVTRKPFCKIAAKTMQVAQAISYRFGWWRRDEQRAKRFDVPAFFVVAMPYERVVSRLRGLFNVEYTFD